ncbi:MAG: chromosome condensation regulator RCC1 [Dehalococcoidia bacterium]
MRPLIAALALVIIAGLNLRAEPATAGGPPDVQATFVETGFGHTCAVTTDGSVQCWGDNNSGQLGDGTETDRPTATPVVGLDPPAKIVALGDSHTCAQSATGAVSCWGYNGEGELGDDTGVDSPIPVDVIGLDSGVSDLASGELHTCAVLSGPVQCWGFNGSGQLGSGTDNDAFAPVTVANLNNAVQIDGGEDDFTCAVTASAAAKCWGNNADGRVGDGTTENRQVPVQVSGLGSGVDTVSAGGNHDCAMMANHSVRCWSSNFQGQLGIGTEDAGSLVPVEVHDMDDAVEITTGAFHSCALTTQRNVYCWGGNANGQLGDGTNFNRSEPVAVKNQTEVVHIAGGYYHTCAVREDGSVWCWGGNQSGQLGDGTLNASNIPIRVTLAAPAGDSRTWGDHNCSGDADPVDSLLTLRFDAGLSTNTGDCPGMGVVVDVASASPHPWGDIDCAGDVNPVDSLKLLRYDGGLNVAQEPDCPAVGTAVTITLPG